MSVTVPRQARARKTFDAILDATATLLLEAGIEGLNTNSVARMAEVDISTLCRYFDDKDALRAAPRKRKALMRELKTLLNAYLDTMPAP